VTFDILYSKRYKPVLNNVFPIILSENSYKIIIYNRTKVFKNNKLNNINCTMYLFIEFDKRLFLAWLTPQKEKQLSLKSYVIIDGFGF